MIMRGAKLQKVLSANLGSSAGHVHLSVCVSLRLSVCTYVCIYVCISALFLCLSVCLWPLRGRACCVFLSSRSNRRAPQRKQRVSPCAPGYHERAHWARIPVAAEVMACSRAHGIPACAWFFRLRVRITAKIIWLNWSKVFFSLTAFVFVQLVRKSTATLAFLYVIVRGYQFICCSISFFSLLSIHFLSVLNTSIWEICRYSSIPSFFWKPVWGKSGLIIVVESCSSPI